MIGGDVDGPSRLRTGRGRHRLFFALCPDAAVSAAIVETVDRLRTQWASGGRRLGRDRHHLTLQFLGEFPEFPQALAQAVLSAGSCVDAPAFSLTLDRAASFDNRAIIWWLGPASVPSGLAVLMQQLAGALQQQGVPPPTQAFIPHVTIVRDARRALAEPVPIAPISWPVRSFALFHSSDGLHGYRVLQEWALSGAVR